MKVLRFEWNVIKTNRRYVHSGLRYYYIGNEENRITKNSFSLANGK